MAAQRIDPFTNFNFLVEIDGVIAAGFSEVSGLAAEVNVIEYREGNDPVLAVRKLPGLRHFSNITLKRGFTKDLSLWNWFNTVLKGAVQRANGSIILRDDTGTPVLRWNFVNGWPCKWEGPHLDGRTSEVAIEELVIAHEGITLVAA
jgi:phage tail-like protein